MSPLRVAFVVCCIAMSAATVRAQAVEPAPRFDILEFEIEGNTLLPPLAVEAAVLPFMGPGRQIADVNQARDALEKAFQAAGYLTVFVDLPEQRVDSGVVRLAVTQGRVDRLKVTGSQYTSQARIRDTVNELAEGHVPDFNAVQRQIASLSREERQLQPVLRPGITPGTVEAEIQVSDRSPLSADIELNNRHAPDTVPWRLQATLRYDNLFQRDHGLALTLITAPENTSQSRVLSANYAVPLGGEDGGSDTWLTYLVASDSVLEPLGAGTVFGKGVTIGTRWLRSRSGLTANHTLSLGFDYKNIKEQLVAGSDALSAPLRFVTLQAGHTGTWFGERGSTTLASSLTAGLRRVLRRDVDCPGNVGPVDQFACKREGGDGGFFYARSDLRQRWSPAGVPGRFDLRLGAQVATGPLPPSEQYVLGGADTVRGYLEGETSGDHGLLGSLEWRSRNLAPAGDGATVPLDELALLGFVDMARAFIAQPSAGQPARVSLLGTGFGLRVRAAKTVDAELDLAWPLKATRSSPDKQPRLHVRVAAQF